MPLETGYGLRYLPGHADDGGFHTAGFTLPMPAGRTPVVGECKLGVRPEYVSLAAADSAGALPMTITQVQDVGTHVIVSATRESHTIKARLSAIPGNLVAGDRVWLQLMGEHTCFYQNEEILA